jgi:hypothetical protein
MKRPKDHIENIAVTAGFMAASLPHGGEMDVLLELWNKGCFELFKELTDYAPLAEGIRLGYIADGADSPGMFDYEVSEEFGQWFADFVMTSPTYDAPTRAEGEGKLREMIQEFFYPPVKAGR